MSDPKWVYGFDEVADAQKAVGGDWDEVRGLLGGKGANLGDMTRLDIPVPPGFSVTTQACLSFLDAGEQFPGDSWTQVEAALATIEKATDKSFGDKQNPLLVSCRSGAKFSMPGMMDTVLNIGLNDDVAEGMIALTGDARFVYDSYRRLIQMFGSVVLGLDDEPFEHVLAAARATAEVENDGDLPVELLQKVIEKFKALAPGFPSEPMEQLKLATEAVFKSWNGKRAIDYRNAAGIDHSLGTAVNIQTMVFGNMGEGSATGVAMSRNATTFLFNAQGEDVVAGTRPTLHMEDMAEQMTDSYGEFAAIANRLETHYTDMQDMEFTVERGKLWLLQTRDGKRTAQAAVRIAIEMADDGLITKKDAVMRVHPDQVDFFLHPQFSVESKAAGNKLAEGLNVSPGAAVGVVAFTADLAEEWAKEDGKKVIMVRPETKPDDVHGMLAAEGILTSKGGRTSHAALVARQFGTPAVVGVAALEIDLPGRTMTVDGVTVAEGDWISIDGTTGEVFTGQLETLVPDISDPWLMKLLGWADELRTLGVWANADYPVDAERARRYGAEGIGLARTEHMFFETERLPLVQQMITATDPAVRQEALDALLPYQRGDFSGLFRAMDGLPVIIRLIDPPLHEFLPEFEALLEEIGETRVALAGSGDTDEQDVLMAKITADEAMLDRVKALHEANPMLGTRGVRLGIMIPELTKMQVRAIFEASCEAAKDGVDVHPEVMIPLTSHVNELKRQREVLEAEAKTVMEEQGITIDYKFGTMIEIPRAALTADEVAEYAEFFSFGTNDLTQTTFGISRDDAESGFLMEYLEQGILDENPFASIDPNGVGKLMGIAVEGGRSTNPDLEIGICGEHGGDPKSIAICHALNLNYVSCSPFRVPVARLAAAQAAVRSGDA